MNTENQDVVELVLLGTFPWNQKVERVVGIKVLIVVSREDVLEEKCRRSAELEKRICHHQSVQIWELQFQGNSCNA
ncbi:hypothetical protein PGB90_004148 [Kerria lacca]